MLISDFYDYEQFNHEYQMLPMLKKLNSMPSHADFSGTERRILKVGKEAHSFVAGECILK